MKTLILMLGLCILPPAYTQAQSISALRKTDWTIQEVKDWAKNQEGNLGWHGWLLYQGSDSSTHYFISRVMDEWVWFHIKRSELQLPDERHYSSRSSAPLGYYYVDPLKEFVKIKDY